MPRIVNHQPHSNRLSLHKHLAQGNDPTFFWFVLNPGFHPTKVFSLLNLMFRNFRIPRGIWEIHCPWFCLFSLGCFRKNHPVLPILHHHPLMLGLQFIHNLSETLHNDRGAESCHQSPPSPDGVETWNLDFCRYLVLAKGKRADSLRSSPDYADALQRFFSDKKQCDSSTVGDGGVFKALFDFSPQKIGGMNPIWRAVFLSSIVLELEGFGYTHVHFFWDHHHNNWELGTPHKCFAFLFQSLFPNRCPDPVKSDHFRIGNIPAEQIL